ncbi:MAG: hypothetical protein GF355_07690 [Candidatus Eisenbacteria bacterium]|nr:hypothetical protein [Candidatus Eisenbacteria bacterium]
MIQREAVHRRMRHFTSLLVFSVLLALLAAGCSQTGGITAPDAQSSLEDPADTWTGAPETGSSALTEDDQEYGKDKDSLSE